MGGERQERARNGADRPNDLGCLACSAAGSHYSIYRLLYGRGYLRTQDGWNLLRRVLKPRYERTLRSLHHGPVKQRHGYHLRTSHTYIPRLSYLSRVEYLKTRVHGKEVLHLGCSSGRYITDRLTRSSLLHETLTTHAQLVYGIDIDAESLEVMRGLGYSNLHCANVEALDALPLDRAFDVVIAGDLLEHITRPGNMLEGIKRFLKPGAEVIISTNNAFGLHYQLKRWTGRFEEHFEHVCFYSPETLVHLFERHGYEARAMYGAFTEPPFGLKQNLLFCVGKPLFRIFPILAGTLVLVSRLTEPRAATEL